jgi:predicted component of type VI protein secretion system
MPEFNTEYQKITDFVKEVPTSTALILQPMTLDAIGQELTSEDALPAKIDNLDAAFQAFQPGIRFKYDGSPEMAVELDFRKMADFDPKNMLKSVPGRRNDLAKLEATIQLLYRIKERWSKPAVRTAWKDPNKRQQIIQAIAGLRAELQSIAGEGKEK